MTTIVIFVAVLAAAYVVGSMPLGYWTVKRKTGIDLRKKGSGSTGATNVGRTMAEHYSDQRVGRRYFLARFHADIAKGALPVLLAGLLPQHTLALQIVAAVGVVTGHCYSCFLQFKGGKAVASGIGTLAALCPWVGLSVYVLWWVITHATKYVSMASMASLIAAPLLMWLFGAPLEAIIYSVLLALFIVSRHHENISRLRNHKENRTDWL